MQNKVLVLLQSGDANVALSYSEPKNKMRKLCPSGRMLMKRGKH